MCSIKLGFMLVALSIIIGCLFFIGSFHASYWSHPAVFTVATVIGVLSAILGSFIIGRNVYNIQNNRVILLISNVIMVIVVLLGIFLAFISCWTIADTLNGSIGAGWLGLAVPLLMIGLFFIVGGVNWLYRSLIGAGRISGASPLLLIALGLVFSLLSGLLGLIAISLAVGIWMSTGYWGEDIYNYNGDYMPLGIQIMALQGCIFLGIVGYFLMGFGVGQRKLMTRTLG